MARGGRESAVALLAWLLTALTALPAGAATSPCDLSYASDSTVAWRCRRMGAGETLESLYGSRWLDVARFNRMDRRHAWPGALIRAPLRLESVAGFSPLPSFYAPAESCAKFILVDLGEQFLGAYERGSLVFAAPIASGRRGHETPTGEFRVDAADPRHLSSLYVIEGTRRPYPMNWALRFHTTRRGVAMWMHGRDLPGVPASHGCIGLTDEAMQKRVYGAPATPEVADARRLYEWVAGRDDGGRMRAIEDGPRVRIVGRAPP